MKEGVRNTLVFDMKDFRDEDFKEYGAVVPSASLDLTYEDAKFINPLSCKVTLFRQGDNNIYATADITTTLSVECRRCINPLAVDITTSVDLLFSIGNESSEQEEDGERYYDGETLIFQKMSGRHLSLKYRHGPSVPKHVKVYVLNVEPNLIRRNAPVR